ncbi:tyrosine-type recombinase/integrase [Sphingomonas phyllosphaerae]|uniref:tyrosine-type recombinase/integrase n=1 Tax=Sphingomonas phyllosphaerae TaxID=257003 RepID=UPI0004213DD2|nr:integrase arm-type DNA-binding domain-containing protein [Sphingomonas phyllosphaerae]
MLTDVACRKAPAKDKPYKLADAHGLYLYVLPTGFKSWRWKYRIGGKEKRLVFGSYPTITLVKAREMREDAARVLREGADPGVSKRQRAAEQTALVGSTFEKIARDWHASQKTGWSARYAAIVLNSFENDVFPRIGKLPITAVTTPLVLEVLRPIEARGAVETAHRVRQRISEVFARAIGAGIAPADPAAVTKRALGRKTKGKFPAARTVKLAQAVLEESEKQPGQPLTKLASRLLALTAVRSATLRNAEVSEFEDLDGPAPIWRVPAAKMKLGVECKQDDAFEFIVPLSRQAVETVKVAIGFSGRDATGLIFRSVRNSRRPISDSTLSKAYREAGFSGVHVPHGWRATFSTVMNELVKEQGRGDDRAAIDLMLAYIPAGVEGDYNRAAYMPRRRELAQEWANLLTDGLAPPASLLEGKRQHA